MRELERYRVAMAPECPAVLRNGTLISRGERSLTIIDGGGPRTVAVDWDLRHHEVTPDGRYLLAIGEEHSRGQVWDIRSGERVLELKKADDNIPLYTSLVPIDNDTYLLFNDQYRRVRLHSLPSGEPRVWLTSHLFYALRMFPLGSNWFGIIGHNSGEYRDIVVAISGHEALTNTQVLATALDERPSVYEWGYTVTIGPADAGRAVLYRDAEWDDDDLPDLEPDEAFRGLQIWDLESRTLLERIPHHEKVPEHTTIGANELIIAIDMGGYVNVVARPSGKIVRRIDAIALDPYRLEVARLDGEYVTISAL